MTRTLPGDWYPGSIPDNVVFEETSYIGSSYNFSRYCSERKVGVQLGSYAVLGSTILDVGPRGKVTIGEHAIITDAYIICDHEVEIGPYALVSWNVVLMDAYRRPVWQAGPAGEGMPPARGIRLGRNCWVGFEVCVLPGVTIGEGSIVGARSVVREDVPPYTIVAGNPARVIRDLR